MNQALALDLLRLISLNPGLSIGAARKKLGVSQSELSRVITLLGADGWLEVQDVDGAQRLHLLERAPES